MASCRLTFAILACAVGCRFDPAATSGPSGDGASGQGAEHDAQIGARDGSPEASDGSAASTFAPVHAPSNDDQPGSGALVLAGAVTINTDTPSYGPAVTGVGFDIANQLGGAPAIAILHVSTLTVSPGAQVTVVGSHPLVVIASGTIDIAGTLDASATGTTPGAGGGGPNADDGTAPAMAGRAGTESGYFDAGGGGGGFGTPGATGGGATCASGACAGTQSGAAGGAASGDASFATLTGGGGGGSPYYQPGQTCGAAYAGAGGGAIQLSTPGTIEIGQDGAVLAGGGGGGGGINGNCNWGAGGGGGAGGAIVLQAASVIDDGAVAANGGGGGAGAGGPSGSGLAGTPGGNGTRSGAGAGGASVGTWSGAGGAGGAAGSSAAVGGTDRNAQGLGNGGGGGGAVGRILMISPSATGGGMYSPTPQPE